MRIYQFKIWGKQFAVDVNTGNFFETDAAASKALTLLEGHTEAESAAILESHYGKAAAGRLLRSFAALKKEGLLFGHFRKSRPVSRKITDLTLNIVEGCNLRCRYCWNKAGTYAGAVKRPKKMAFAVAAGAVDLLLKESRGSRDLVVDFYGGEPLLNFDLIRRTIEYCNDISRRRKIKFRFLLATNGTLLDKEKADFMISNGVDIAVSLDGSPRIQDTQRPFADGTGSFGRIMENLSAIGPKERSRLVGRATFTPYSQDTVATFRFLRRLGFDRIEVCESEKAGYGLDGNTGFFFSGAKGIERLKSIYDRLARFYTREIISGRMTYENTYFNRFFKQLSRLYHIQSIVGTCSAGFSLMAVDMDGSVYPCTAFVGVPEFKIGTVRRGIDRDKLARFSDTKIDADAACAGCWAKRICRGCGSCYNLNYFTSRTPGKPDPYYCELFRYKTKLMIAMISKISSEKPRQLEKVLIPEYYARRGRKA